MKYLLAGLLLFAGCGGDDCNSDTVCGDGSYRLCSGGASDCYYSTSDGQKFHCTTCGDCSNALQLVDTWCVQHPGRSTGGSGSNDVCQRSTCASGSGWFDACASPSGSSCSIKTSDGMTYACNSCSDCTAAAMNAANWCAGGGSNTTTGGNNTTTGGSNTTTGGNTTGGQSAACDVVGQSCPSGQKCTTALDASGMEVGQCVPDGTVGLGQSCIADNNDPTRWDDNCKAGGFCVDVGGIGSVCRKVCVSDSACAGGERCIGDGTGYGLCLPICTPFSSAAGNCEVGADCSDAVEDYDGKTVYVICKPTGSTAAWGTCATDGDCVAGSVCNISGNAQPNACQPTCDATHACPPPPGHTASCKMLSSSDPIGYCQES
jgi:hypothetical protein